MDFGMETGIFLAYTAGIMAIYFLGKWLLVPLKALLKLLASSVAGGAVLLCVNLLGSGFGIFLPLNIITASIVGVMGIPGTAGLLLYFNVLATGAAG